MNTIKDIFLIFNTVIVLAVVVYFTILIKEPQQLDSVKGYNLNLLKGEKRLDSLDLVIKGIHERRVEDSVHFTGLLNGNAIEVQRLKIKSHNVIFKPAKKYSIPQLDSAINGLYPDSLGADFFFW